MPPKRTPRSSRIIQRLTSPRQADGDAPASDLGGVVNEEALEVSQPEGGSAPAPAPAPDTGLDGGAGADTRGWRR